MTLVPTLEFREGQGGVPVDLGRLVASRLLVQGSSGAGKSFLTRYLLEQTHGRIQQFVIDPEGEFSTLRERFDYVVASADGEGDVPAHPKSADLLCRQLVELGASAILDIYELDPIDRQKFVGAFLHRLVNLPKGSWRPALVVVDEAHEFAPESGGEPPSRRPMELVVSKGRKRGLCAIYLTQRLSKLSKSASDLQNVLIGYTGLDTDVRRAGDMLGFDKGQREDLKRLDPGEFFAFGPAISREVQKVRSGKVTTHHPKPGEIRAPTPPPRGALLDLVSQLEGIAGRAAEEERTIAALESEVRELRRSKGGGVTRAEVDRLIDAAEAPLREEIARLSGYRERINGARPIAEQLVAALQNGSSGHEDAPTRKAEGGGSTTRPVTPPRRRPGTSDSPEREGLTTPQRRILDALAWLAAVGIEPANATAVAFIAGYRPGSGGFNNPKGQLRSAGLVDYPSPGMVALTEEGWAAAAEPDAPGSLSDLHRMVMDRLQSPEQRILEPLLECHPSDMDANELAEAAGYSPGSGGFNNPRGRLRTLGLIDYPTPGRVVALDVLFPEGLR